MPELEFPTEKPFAGVRRERHDGTNGRVALHGHTARMASYDSCDGAAELKRQLPSCRNHDYLDKDKAYGTPSTSRLAEPYALTALELNGVESTHSLQKGNAWATVPSLLASNCVGLPSSMKLSNGKVETQYQLLPEGVLLPDPAVAAAEHRLSTHLYEIKRHRPQLEAVFPTDPPEGVTSPLLKATLKCRGMHVPQSAIVRVNQHASRFDVARAQGKPLEIDLGTSCAISAFSTMGRHPSTRLYPRVSCDRVPGGSVSSFSWSVEDGDYLPGHTPGAKYNGPYWTVRDERLADGSPHTNTPAWVSRYELWWRADGGRQWHRLGCFVGNADDVSEVAHSLSELAPGRRGLVARYLRIVPLESEGGGAMRVGVYGERLGPEEGSVGRRRARLEPRSFQQAWQTMPDGAESAETGLVTYTLTSRQASASAAPRPRSHVRDGLGLGTRCCKYNDGYGRGKRLRAPVKRSLRDHAAEMLQEWREEREERSCRSDCMHPCSLSAAWPLRRICLREEQEEREELELAMALSMSMMAQEHASTSASEGEGSDVVTEGSDAVTEGTDAVTVEQMAEVVAREWDLECRSGSDEGAEEQSAEEEEWVVVEAQGLAV